MIDIIRLRKAYSVLNRLSQGRNPFSDNDLTVGVMNSLEVRQVLIDSMEVIATYGKLMNLVTQSTDFRVLGSSGSRKQPFYVTKEAAHSIKPINEQVYISVLAKHINEYLGNENMRKLSAVGLGSWLVAKGYLEILENSKTKIATAKGNQLGISTHERTNFNGQVYYSNLYTPEAQRFILDSLPEIAEFLQRPDIAQKDVQVES